MDAADVADLRRTLADAQELVAGLEPRGPRTGARPRFLRSTELREAVQAIGGHDGPITLIVGAGASMEADLPSWGALVARVLHASRPRLDEDLRARWVAAVLSEGVVSGAAVAQALAPSQPAFRDRVVRELYRGRRSRAYVPGAISEQVAWFKRRFPADVTIATFNYDDLLEQALEPHGAVRAAVDDAPEAPGEAAVRHLHGRLHDGHHDDDFVLSDDDYARFPLRPRWQDRVMRRALERSMCVFVGLSFTDPNLTRWIHRSDVDGGPPRIALFSRQSSPRLAPDVRRELELTTAQRWGQAGVRVVFTDFFGELGQVLHEAALVRAGDPVPPFAARAQRRQAVASRLLTPAGSQRFPAAQRAAADWLRGVVDGVQAIIRSNRVRFRDEQLAVGVWLADHGRGEVLLAATSDRAMTDRASLQPIPMELLSPWAGVETVTRGVVVEQHPDVYATRWRYARGLPLVVEDGRAGRTAVGAVTLTSTRPYAESVFARLHASVQDEVDAFVVAQALGVFELG
jgi:hypothetical protein